VVLLALDGLFIDHLVLVPIILRVLDIKWDQHFSYKRLTQIAGTHSYNPLLGEPIRLRDRTFLVTVISSD
jgi:hypothetical protein